MNPACLSKNKTTTKKQPPNQNKLKKPTKTKQAKTPPLNTETATGLERKAALPPPAFLSNTPDLALEVITSLSLEVLQF